MSAIKQHMLFLCSNDSAKLYLNNSKNDFIIELGETYELNGTWTVELMDIQCSLANNTISKHMYVFTDLCEHSYVNDKHLPILRRIPLLKKKNIDKSFAQPYAVKVAHSQIQRIRVYIMDEKNKPVSFSSEPVYLTLRLKSTT